jgi:hypothetical protein
MRNKIIVGSTIALALVATLTARTASAQAYPEDKRVFFTFNGPVAVPGVTLPAGKYLFRLTTSIASGERHVVQVLSDNGQTSYAQFFGVSAVRPDYAPKPEIRFMETAAGMPPAVKTWWYPGAKDGYEFIYPKDQARLLAKGTGQPVLTTRADTATEIERVTAAGAETAVRAEVPARPEGPIVVGEVAPPAMPVIEPTLEARADLPKTASATGLIALVAMGLLLTAAFVRGARIALG